MPSVAAATTRIIIPVKVLVRTILISQTKYCKKSYTKEIFL